MTSTGNAGVSPAALPAFDGTTPFTEQPRRAFVEQIMGLPISVHVRGPKAAGVQVSGEVTEFYTALRADDELFSTWKPDSGQSNPPRS